jgi:Fic family protein
MPAAYSPPYTITSASLTFVAEIAAQVARLEDWSSEDYVPKLRRDNRIRSIHASLAIENNTLSLEQVTAVIAGKRVLGPPSEIQEVKNAFAAYEGMTTWIPSSSKDILTAHRLLMLGLATDAGRFRTSSVGIAQGENIVHLAPPASRVASLMKDLLHWLKRTDAHPLISSCIFHYELEFIHPFTDGNGRMGRLWQTLILSRWNPLFAHLPVESVIRERQYDYYKVLGACDNAGNSTAFIEFLLDALLYALRELAHKTFDSEPSTPQVAPQETPQVNRLLSIIDGEHSREELQSRLQLADREHFRKSYLLAALAAGLIERTIPEKPNSRLQKYRLTPKGKSLITSH